MKEQALKIVTDLIDSHKIKGEDAIILIQAILKESNPPYYPSLTTPSPISVKDISNPQCNPYPGTITTTVTGNINNDINTTSSKGVEVIYG